MFVAFLNTTVGKQNYFMNEVMYFTAFIWSVVIKLSVLSMTTVGCGQISMNMPDILYTEMHSHRQEAREVGFYSPWSNSAYPQWYMPYQEVNRVWYIKVIGVTIWLSNNWEAGR